MRGFRRENQRSREAANRIANEWLICPKHGGYSPNVKAQHGWVRRDFPGCARERYNAASPGLDLSPTPTSLEASSPVSASSSR